MVKDPLTSTGSILAAIKLQIRYPAPTSSLVLRLYASDNPELPMSDQAAPAEPLRKLFALHQQLRAARHTPDGTVHTPPSEAERVLEAATGCFASLLQRVTALEACAPSPMAAVDSAKIPLAAE